MFFFCRFSGPSFAISRRHLKIDSLSLGVGRYEMLYLDVEDRYLKAV